MTAVSSGSRLTSERTHSGDVFVNFKLLELRRLLETTALSRVKCRK